MADSFRENWSADLTSARTQILLLKHVQASKPAHATDIFSIFASMFGYFSPSVGPRCVLCVSSFFVLLCFLVCWAFVVFFVTIEITNVKFSHREIIYLFPSYSEAEVRLLHSSNWFVWLQQRCNVSPGRGSWPRWTCNTTDCIEKQMWTSNFTSVQMLPPIRTRRYHIQLVSVHDP